MRAWKKVLTEHNNTRQDITRQYRTKQNISSLHLCRLANITTQNNTEQHSTLQDRTQQNITSIFEGFIASKHTKKQDRRVHLKTTQWNTAQHSTIDYRFLRYACNEQ